MLILSLLAFGLSECTPSDPVESLLPPDEVRGSIDNPTAYDNAYQNYARQLRVDRPAFYFSIRNAAYPDTLHRILRQDQKKIQLALAREFGNWPAVQDYYRELRRVAYASTEAAESKMARSLLLQADSKQISFKLTELPDSLPLVSYWQALTAHPKRGNLLLPRFRWQGIDNRYHHWMRNTLRGEFGRSYVNRRTVSEKIWPALKWTALMNGIALFLAYFISIPLGMYTAYYAGSRFDRYSTFLVFLLFSLPSFWLATLLSNFFTTPFYGMDWFPSMGFGNPDPNGGWLEYLQVRVAHLFLPVFCLVYPALAYLTRQMRIATVQELNKAYVTTARLKGLNVHQILWKHVFRNALFPIITLLASLLPAVLAGSVLIEIIFNLPGMGRLLIDSTSARDWPVVLTILLLNGVLTVIGILIADVLYSWADPRVKLTSSQKMDT